MRNFGLLALVVLILGGCSGAAEFNTPDPEPAPDLPADSTQFDLDAPFRESQGLLQGDITLNGGTEVDPNWDPSPLPISQQVYQGTMALFRVKGKLSNSASTTLYTKLSQPGKNYPSYAIPGTNVDQYKALYIEQPDILTWTFYNSTSYNTPINSKSASFNYSFKTQALENADEPNDDDNGATITDRTLAKSIGLGATSTRSVFQVDNSPLKDVEEWYKVTLAANQRIQWKFATTPGQYSSWSFVMKMYTNGGNQVGPTINVASTDATATLEHKIGSAGTYYLQIVGTPVSKSYTNMFYKLYTITPCIPPEVTNLNFTPLSAVCPGAAMSLSADTINGATGYSWNFGGGATPNTSTSPNPTVTAGVPGEYSLSLTVSNACGSKTYVYGYQIGCSGMVGVMGGEASVARPVDIVVEPSGRSHVLYIFRGSVDLDPGAGEQVAICDSQTFGMAVAQLDAQADLTALQVWSPLYFAGESLAPLSMTYNVTSGYRIVGTYAGTIDFDPGTSYAIRESSTAGSAFVLALSPDLAFQWIVTLPSSIVPRQVVYRSGSSQAFIAGVFSETVDFDPGLTTFTRTSNGSSDSFCLLLDGNSAFLNAVAWGGDGIDLVRDAAADGMLLQLAGQFQNTVDFDPGITADYSTALGATAAFVVRLNPDAGMGYQGHLVLTGEGGRLIRAGGWC